MVNVLFVHDLIFRVDGDGNIFGRAGLDEKYFDRFFCSGYSQVKILSRVKCIEPSEMIAFGNKEILLSKARLGNYFGLLNPFFYTRLFKDLKQSRLVVISTPSVIGSFVTLVCIIAKKPYAVEVAGDGDAFLSKKGGWAFSTFLNVMMPLFIRKAYGAAYVTKFLASKFPNKNNIVITSNVNIEEVSPRRFLSESLIKKQKVNIGFVGGLNRRKGVDVLIKAASRLIVEQGYHNLQFHLVGGHEDFRLESMLTQLFVREYFVLHGLKSKHGVMELMVDFDLYVQPSLSEGLPRATIEAMSFSLPVVATKLPGFYEILVEDALVEIASAGGLADKIEQFLCSEELYNEHSSRNLEVASRFLYSTLHPKRCEYYRSFIETQ